MSSTTATTANTALDTPEGQEVRVQSEQSKFVQHLASYPAVSALAGLIASFPLAKIFVSNAIPLLYAIHQRTKPVSDTVTETTAPYLRSLDNAGDAALNQLDSRFPKLQTVQPSDVYEGAQNYLGSVKGNAYATYDARIIQPLTNVTSAARNQIDIAAPKVKDVYSTKLNEKTGDGEDPSYVTKLLAALATGKFLSVESYNQVLNYFGSPEKLENAVGEIKAATAAAADSVVSKEEVAAK